jgi:hypothetical protein
MSRADYVINRVDNALRRIGGLSRTSYKRVTTITGGDPEIGRPGTVTPVDTAFSPQPYYRQLGQKQAMILSGNTGRNLVADDYVFTFSAKTVSQSDFQDKNVSLVLKDSAGRVEVLKIVYINSEALGGKDVVLRVFARSVSRQ